MNASRKFLLLAGVAALAAGVCVAQNFGGGRRGRGFGGGGGRFGDGRSDRTEGGVWVDPDTVRTAREVPPNSFAEPTPNWTNPPGFQRDVFTFARLIRDHGSGPDCPYTAGRWLTDFPDSDLNLSYRLQQLTALRTDPDGRTIKLTDPELLNYPWIYSVEPGSLSLRDEEVPILRKYLLNGGVFMADDFWGQWQWDYFERQVKRVLPEREFTELDISHPIFHCVFDLNGSVADLQTPGERDFMRNGRNPTITWETHPRADGGSEACRPMHVRAIFDNKGRIMVIAAFNTDNGDGWEREGEYQDFFDHFSEKRAYPLGINIIFYLMTH